MKSYFQMCAFLITAIALFASVITNAQSSDSPIASTLRADGSTNMWTQADLTDALGLMNRKYWRDMETDAGRRQWHGDRMMQYIFENNEGKLMRVDLYADGFCYTNFAQKAKSNVPDPEAKAKQEAAMRAWEMSNLPPELAALRGLQRQASEAASSNITVYVEGN